MTRTFNVAELLRVAVIEERNGISFYDALAERADDAGLRQTFKELADAEREHERAFQAMLDDFKDAQKGESQYPDIYVDYLETLVNEIRQEESVAESKQVQGDAEAVDVAIRLERDQLALQRDIAEVLGEAHEETTQQIIDEERGHLATLGRARKALSGNG